MKVEMIVRVINHLKCKQGITSRSWILAVLKKCVTGDMHQLCSNLENVALEKPIFVLTPNLSHLRITSRKEGFIKTYLLGDYVLADGMPIRWLANKLVHVQVNRLSGVDLVNKLIENEARFSVIGSSERTVKDALKVHGKSALYVPVFENIISNDASDEEIELVLKFIELNKRRYVLLAVTTEKQLDLMHKISQIPTSTPAIYIGVGGSFDMISRRYVRAPKLIQDIGLEWFWRAIQNPRVLIPRYSKDFLFLIVFLSSTLRLGKERNHDEFS